MSRFKIKSTLAINVNYLEKGLVHVLTQPSLLIAFLDTFDISLEIRSKFILTTFLQFSISFNRRIKSYKNKSQKAINDRKSR